MPIQDCKPEITIQPLFLSSLPDIEFLLTYRSLHKFRPALYRELESNLPQNQFHFYFILISVMFGGMISDLIADSNGN